MGCGEPHFGPGGSEELKVLCCCLKWKLLTYISKNNSLYIYIEQQKENKIWWGVWICCSFFCTEVPRRYLEDIMVDTAKLGDFICCQAHLFWIYRYSVILRTSSLANERFIEDVGTYILLFISPGVNISELIHALLPLAVLQVLPLSLNHLQKKDTTSSPPKNSSVQQLLATKKNIRQASNKRNQWLIVP